MSAAKDVAAAVSRLVQTRSKGAPTAVPESLPDQGDPIAVLVQSILLWQSTTEKAAAAYERIRKTFLDWNDLRVSMPAEVMEVLGPRYPEAEDRCRRLRAILQGVYRREHEMGFGTAEAAGKRSLRKYLEALEGMVPYVAERMLLVGFGGHGLPVDETLRLHLVAEGIVDEAADDAEAAAVLLRHVKAADALQVHLALQAWTDEVGPPKARASSTGSRRRTGASAAKSAGKSGSKSGSGTAANSKKKTKKTTSGASTKAASASKSKAKSGSGSGTRSTTKSTRSSTTKKTTRAAAGKSAASSSSGSKSAARSPRKTASRSGGTRKTAGRTAG